MAKNISNVQSLNHIFEAAGGDMETFYAALLQLGYTKKQAQKCCQKVQEYRESFVNDNFYTNSTEVDFTKSPTTSTTSTPTSASSNVSNQSSKKKKPEPEPVTNVPEPSWDDMDNSEKWKARTRDLHSWLDRVQEKFKDRDFSGLRERIEAATTGNEYIDDKGDSWKGSFSDEIGDHSWADLLEWVGKEIEEVGRNAGIEYKHWGRDFFGFLYDVDPEGYKEHTKSKPAPTPEPVTNVPEPSWDDMSEIEQRATRKKDLREWLDRVQEKFKDKDFSGLRERIHSVTYGVEYHDDEGGLWGEYVDKKGERSPFNNSWEDLLEWVGKEVKELERDSGIEYEHWKRDFTDWKDIRERTHPKKKPEPEPTPTPSTSGDNTDWEPFSNNREKERREAENKKKEASQRDRRRRRELANIYREQIEDEAEPYWKGLTLQNRPSYSEVAPEVLTNVPFAFTGEGDAKDILPFPVHGEKFASTRAHERARIESQPFIEWALKQYPMASDSFILRLGKDMGFALSGHWIADVRNVMDVPRPDFKTTEAADTFYEVHSLHQKAISRRGDLGHRTESGVVSDLTRANPFSRFNKERRQAEKEFRNAEARREQLANDVHVARNAGVGAEGIERLDDRLREYVSSDEYQRAVKDREAYQRGSSVDYSTGRRTKSGAAVARDFTDEDEAAFQKREEILDDITQSWDPRRKEVKRGHVFNKETQGAIRAKDKEDYIYRTSAGAGGLGVKGVLTRLGKIGATLMAIYAVGKKVYSAIKDSLQKTWELAPYNARLGAVKAQYEGKEFQRTVEFAAGTEEKRVELAREWDEFLDTTQELRIAFANLALMIQSIIVKIAGSKEFWNKWTGGINRYTTPQGALRNTFDFLMFFEKSSRAKKEREEREEYEERIEGYESARKKNFDEVVATSTLAREYYETGKINKAAQAASPYADKSAVELMALLHDKDMRASFEDAIAYTDIIRGGDYFQGYSDVEKGSATTRDDLIKILQVLDNANLLTTQQLDVLLATERAAQETAENTRANKTNKENLLNQPIFVAMQKMAQSFAPTGNETAYTSDERNQWGAEPKKLYGRFAGPTNIWHKGEDTP